MEYFKTPTLLQSIVISPKQHLIHFLVLQIFTEDLTWAKPYAKYRGSDLKSQPVSSRKS